jgi:hypothetical protein
MLTQETDPSLHERHTRCVVGIVRFSIILLDVLKAHRTASQGDV